MGSPFTPRGANGLKSGSPTAPATTVSYNRAESATYGRCDPLARLVARGRPDSALGADGPGQASCASSRAGCCVTSGPITRFSRRLWSTRPTCALKGSGRCGWRTAGISTGPRRRRCGASWSTTRADGRPPSAAARRRTRCRWTPPRSAGRLRLDFERVDQALEGLAAVAPEKAKVAELRYFAGLSIEETGEVLGISPATVKRHWTFARAWLYRALEG